MQCFDAKEVFLVPPSFFKKVLYNLVIYDYDVGVSQVLVIIFMFKFLI